VSATDLITGWKAMEAALPGYLAAEAYYEGTAKEVFASERIADKLRQTAGRYRFNLAKTPVKVLANKIKLAAVTGTTDEITDRIREISEANNLEVEFPDLIRMALEYGDSYLMSWPLDPDDVPDDVQPDPELEAAQVELVVHNPKHNRMMYDPANRRRKWFYIRRWCVDRPGDIYVWRVDLWYADRVEHWVSLTSDNLTQESGWATFTGFPGEPDTAVEAVEDNPLGEIPAFHYRTALPYGVPVHRDAYGSQDAVTKLLCTQLDTVDTVGYPARFALTDAGAELDQASDDPDFPDGDDANAPAAGDRLASSSNIRSGPGTLSYLHGVKNLVQFDPADPGTLLDPTEFFIRLMAQQTQIPMDSFDPNGEVPSGESLKVKHGPLNANAKDLQTAFTAPTLEAWKFTLKVVSVKAGTLEVRWVPVEQATGKEDWEVVALKQGAGVPQGQTLVEAGYEQETVDGWLDDEAEDMDLMRRADLMVKVADAAQKLGAAVGSGVMTAEQAQEVISLLAGVQKEKVEGPPDPVALAEATAKAKAAAGGKPSGTNQGRAEGDQA
jgi:hypothetical protein